MKTRNVVGGSMGVLVLLAAGAHALTWRSEIDEVARPAPDATDPGLIELGDRLVAAGNSIAGAGIGNATHNAVGIRLTELPLTRIKVVATLDQRQFS